MQQINSIASNIKLLNDLTRSTYYHNNNKLFYDYAVQPLYT